MGHISAKMNGLTQQRDYSLRAVVSRAKNTTTTVSAAALQNSCILWGGRERVFTCSHLSLFQSSYFISQNAASASKYFQLPMIHNSDKILSILQCP